MTTSRLPALADSVNTRILITGCTGYVGMQLSLLIKEVYSNVHLTGLSRVRPLNKEPFDELIIADLRDSSLLNTLLTTTSPYNYVFHLAAQSYVQNSWEYPDITYQTNLGGTENLIKAIKLQLTQKKSSLKPKIILSSSSEVYQYSADHQLIQESSPIEPRSPYGLSKYGQELILKRESKDETISYTILRLFNHSGPGRPPIFIDTKTAHYISEIEIGQRKPILSYRTLNATRDFLDHRDALASYIWCLDSSTDNKILNVCSSSPLSLRDLVMRFIALSTNKHIHVHIESLTSTLPSDGGYLVGSNARIVNITGWRPRYSFIRDTVPLILAYSRSILSS